MYLGLAMIAIVLGLCGMWAMNLEQQVEGLEQERVAKETLRDRLRAARKNQESMESEAALRLAAHARVLPYEQKMGPVRLLDGISRSIQPLKLWIQQLSLDETHVEIHGRALHSGEIDHFVEALEERYPDEDLVSVEIKEGRYQDIPVHDFHVQWPWNG